MFRSCQRRISRQPGIAIIAKFFITMNKKDISIIKNQIRNAIYNMVNRLNKKDNKLGELHKKETRDILLDMDKSKMQRTLSFVYMIPT